MTAQNNPFLDKDYEVPKGDSNYMTLENGENRIRILSHPIIGWEDWKDSKPFRFRMNEKPDKPFVQGKSIKHFWAMVVWNYADEAIQIFHPIQSTIQEPIRELSRSEDWGKPFDYDIKINRSGQDLNTKYSVMPLPKTEISQIIQEALRAKPVNLEALFSGGDPFDVKEGEEIIDDMPF